MGQQNLPENRQEPWRYLFQFIALLILPLIPILSGIFTEDKVHFYTTLGILFIVALGSLAALWKSLSDSKKLLYITIMILSTLFMIFGYNFIITPKFEISVFTAEEKSSSDQIDVIEVTDPLITLNDPSQSEKYPYDFYIEVEILPDFKVSQSYGEIDLRIISKDSSKHEDYKIWDVLDQQTKPAKIKIPLSDIVSKSGIKRNKDSRETNLGLLPSNQPSNEPSIILNIIRRADPQNPLSTKTIKIRNTPWEQRTAIASREGHWVLDYSIKNLGKDGSFGYRVSIAKVDKGVSASEHAFWSGDTDYLDDFKTDLNADLFLLKNGEERGESIVLDDNKAKARGRYVVQVYTYKKLDFKSDDPRYGPDENLKNFNDSWLFSTGNVLTYVDCDENGKSCYDSVVLPIEEIGVSAKSIVSEQKLDTENKSSAFLQTDSYRLNGYITSRYSLKYSIDPQKEGWAGVYIAFQKPEDISSYRSIRMNIKFSNENAPIWFQLILNGKKYPVLLGHGDYGKPITTEQSIVVPLSGFEGADLNNIEALFFVSDQSLVPTAEEYQFTVGQIEFIR
ncbi:MAG: hypothetical protein WCI88_10435 [Chloroflexota bacterium]